MKQYKTILVALDVFEKCDAIIEQAQCLQKRFDADLHFVYTFPIMISSMPYAYDAQEQIKKEADEKLTIITHHFNLNKKQLHSRYGTPKNEISACAEEIKADLILIGSHGKHGIGLVVGSTANGVLHTAQCDVLTVRVDHENTHMCSNNYKNIVVADDLESDNDQVIGQARVMAATYDANLHLINIVPYTTTTAVSYYPNIDVELKEKAAKQLKKLAQSIDVPVDQTKIEIGVPRTEIVKYAEESKSDLIILGSHGRGVISSAILGSTANAVLHAAKQDILVVRI